MARTKHSAANEPNTTCDALFRRGANGNDVKKTSPSQIKHDRCTNYETGDIHVCFGRQNESH
ncbi:MAG: hypothetical protein ACLPN1_03955 [Dissulfurispiraceae bacterium]